MSRFVTSFVTLIYLSWMKELIPIFWQMTDMVIDYILDIFGVPDLHPRSQERPQKSGRVSDFWIVCFAFLDVSCCFRGFSKLFRLFFGWTILRKGDWQNFGNVLDFLFYFFQSFGGLGNFFFLLIGGNLFWKGNWQNLFNKIS